MMPHKICLIACTLISAFLTNTAFSATYPLPRSGNDIVGENYYVKTQPGDTLASVGLRYGMSFHEMTEANPGISKDRKLGAGKKVLIPSQFILPPFRKGIVVNLAELRMYYFTSDGRYVMTFPVAMGRDQWRTPTTLTSVVQKEPNPVWNVPDSIRAYSLENGKWLPKSVPPGPDNPLGKYALHLGKAGYLIHGNNSASSIGKYVSSGCIRMNNKDIELLYSMVKVGTPVYIIHYPNKIGWHNGVLYQESQIPVSLPDDVPSALNQASLNQTIETKLGSNQAYIDWKAAEGVAKKHSGMPMPIGEKGASTTSNKHHQAISFSDVPQQVPDPYVVVHDYDSSNVNFSADGDGSMQTFDWSDEESSINN